MFHSLWSSTKRWIHKLCRKKTLRLALDAQKRAGARVECKSKRHAANEAENDAPHTKAIAQLAVDCINDLSGMTPVALPTVDDGDNPSHDNKPSNQEPEAEPATTNVDDYEKPSNPEYPGKLSRLVTSMKEKEERRRQRKIFCLLDLPAELRDQIYEDALVKEVIPITVRLGHPTEPLRHGKRKPFAKRKRISFGAPLDPLYASGSWACCRPPFSKDAAPYCTGAPPNIGRYSNPDIPLIVGNTDQRHHSNISTETRPVPLRKFVCAPRSRKVKLRLPLRMLQYSELSYPYALGRKTSKIFGEDTPQAFMRDRPRLALQRTSKQVHGEYLSRAFAYETLVVNDRMQYSFEDYTLPSGAYEVRNLEVNLLLFCMSHLPRYHHRDVEGCQGVYELLHHYERVKDLIERMRNLKSVTIHFNNASSCVHTWSDEAKKTAPIPCVAFLARRIALFRSLPGLRKMTFALYDHYCHPGIDGPREVLYEWSSENLDG